MRPTGRSMTHGGMCMETSSLGVIEKKVLGAMLVLANEHMITTSTNKRIAELMGYKTSGGAITFALQALEMKNFINVHSKGVYHVLL